GWLRRGRGRPARGKETDARDAQADLEERTPRYPTHHCHLVHPPGRAVGCRPGSRLAVNHRRAWQRSNIGWTLRQGGVFVGCALGQACLEALRPLAFSLSYFWEADPFRMRSTYAEVGRSMRDAIE